LRPELCFGLRPEFGRFPPRVRPELLAVTMLGIDSAENDIDPRFSRIQEQFGDLRHLVKI
jgi:hypothetical protein